jgi:hypothetical protein
MMNQFQPGQFNSGAPEAPLPFNDIAEYHYQAGVLNNPYYFITFTVCLIGVLIIAFFAWRYYRRTIILTSWDLAQNQLLELDPTKCDQQADFIKFYVGLTRVLKWYVEKRFDLSVNDKTDDEVVVFLLQQATSRKSYAELYNALDAQYADLEKLFEGAKYVKFAQVAALKERASKDLATAKEFIKRTVPTKK